MSKGAKTAITVVVAIGLIAAAFWGGTFYSSKISGSGKAAGGPNGTGGPMGNLSSADRAKIQNMSDSERQAYFQQKMGSQGGSGRAGGAGGGAPSLEGSVVEVSGKTVTLKLGSGGSSTVYLTSDTVVAYAKGTQQKDLAAGDNVIVIATPATDNVMNATAVIIK